MKNVNELLNNIYIFLFNKQVHNNINGRVKKNLIKMLSNNARVNVLLTMT